MEDEHGGARWTGDAQADGGTAGTVLDEDGGAGDGVAEASTATAKARLMARMAGQPSAPRTRAIRKERGGRRETGRVSSAPSDVRHGPLPSPHCSDSPLLLDLGA